jgi:alpha-L-rhamnosidase
MMILTLPLLIASASSLSPANLRCEYLVNPIGIAETSPRLSWVDVSDQRGTKQFAYQIRVTTDGASGVVWDSGKVTSSHTTQIPYEGPTLPPGTMATWTVTVWSESGGSKTSSKATWEQGPARGQDWQAKWVSMATDAKDPLTIPSPLFRKVFQVSKPIRKARAYVSAKGLYNLFIDGHRVGHQLLTPGWTDYGKRIQYEAYDVTSLAKPGQHGVGLMLGNGWYCGHIGLTGGDNYGKYPEALVQLVVTYTDGSKDVIASDGSWKTKIGPISSDDLLMGETYDARNEIKGWSEAKFDDSSWSAPQVHVLGDVPLVPDSAPPIEKITEIKPKAMIPQTAPGTFLFDLGQNMVGWARLKVKGPAGTQVRLRFAEMLNPDKSAYTTNLRGAKATDYYTLSGSGEEVYEPSFTSHGFRYVEVTGYPGTPTLDAITGVVVGSHNPQTGTFACSNALVNQLQHNIYWGEQGNYLSVPTDCPQRDERLGWMGDAQIFVRTACFNNDVASFMTKWTQDVVDAQSPAGGFSDVSPRKGDPSDGAPAWGDAGVIVPYTIYLCYGDTRILDRRYPAMRNWIEYIDSVNPNHIWINRSNNNFGDWLNVHDDTPRDVIATAYFAYSTDLLAKTARILGKTEDAEHYVTLRDQIRQAFRDNFVDDQVKIKGDTQTDYVLALRFDLLKPEQRAAAAKRLVDHIVIDRKTHLSTGFVGVGYLNPTLTSIGRSDVAYSLLLNDTYPSWGYSIRQGATTIWERWDGWTQDKGFQDPGMNSFNHYSLGSVGEWMYNRVAGIDLDPSAPGYEKIVIKPTLGGGLTWASGTLESMHGHIESKWKLDGSRLTLDVEIPANTTATIYVPSKGSDAVTESGMEAMKAIGLTFIGQQDGCSVFAATNGKFHFTSVVK